MLHAKVNKVATSNGVQAKMEHKMYMYTTVQIVI